jgi:hypothetical protein
MRSVTGRESVIVPKLRAILFDVDDTLYSTTQFAALAGLQ